MSGLVSRRMSMANPVSSSIARIVQATGYSLNGLGDAWRTQPAFRYECYVLVLAVPLAWAMGKNATERSLLIGSWMMVIVVELINCAVEIAVDRIGLERHALSGRAKDLGSAAVFCAIALSATIWVILCLG